MNFNSAERRSHQKSRMKSFDPRRRKPKAWSHQQELTDLIDKPIVITRRDGCILSGTLLAADQFCLKIQHTSNSHIVVFKSALTSFKPGA